MIERSRRKNALGQLGRPRSFAPRDLLEKRWEANYQRRLERRGMVNVRFLMTREDAALLAELGRVEGIPRGAVIGRLLARYRCAEAAWPRMGPQPRIKPQPEEPRCEQLLLSDASHLQPRHGGAGVPSGGDVTRNAQG